MFFAVRFTLSQSSPPVKNATHLRTFCFLDFIYAFWEIFVNQRVLLQLHLHWARPKLPWWMQRIYEPFVLKTIIMPFERLFLLWHSLIRLIFVPLIHSAPIHSCAFHTVCFISYVYYRLKYISYPWWFGWSAKARNVTCIFNFSSQRPQLNYTLLSCVYSFDTIEFSIKHKC